MKVWIDVTGLYRWSGNFTGIQRIMYNLAQELETADINSGLFVYHSGNYKEITLVDLDRRLEEINKNLSSTTKNEVTSYLKLNKINHYLLLNLKKAVRGSFVEPQLRGAYGFLRGTYRRARGVPQHMHFNNIFHQGDMVLIIDGNWQFKGFEDSITAEKAKHGFYLYHMVQDLNAWSNPALANKDADRIIGNYFKKIFKHADGLIAISESTKRDVEWFLKVNNISNKPKLFTITLGTDIKLKDGQQPLAPRLNIPKDFILAVSTIEIRKNYLLFYYIYNLAFQKDIKLPHLVIVGRKGWMADEAYILLTKDPKINKSITVCTSIEDGELAWLYQNCSYSAFPSFYEGWGLPVAESLSYGKCCISSDTSSMPEVGKELVIYASPYDPAAFLEQMQRLNNKKLRSQLEADIKDNYKPPTWRDTLNQLIKIVNDL